MMTLLELSKRRLWWGLTLAALTGFLGLAPAVAQGHAPIVPLAIQDDPQAGVMTARLGPVPLPAGHARGAVGLRDVYLTVPFDGWLVAFHPRLVAADGSGKPNKLLHHVSFWNTARPDFLCPNKQEYVFGSGGEMNAWPRLRDLGYRVAAGDSIRIESRFHNPTEEPHLDTYLEVEIRYVRVGGPDAPLTDAYPAKLNVKGCAPSGYLLRVGDTSREAGFSVPFSGTLEGVGGHLHDYGQALRLRDVTRGREVARLRPELDPDGRILSMPIITFPPEAGYRLEAGDSLSVIADYRVTMQQLPAAAMGILIGQFVPDDPSRLAALRNP